jgi:hypothetical protein
MTTIQMDRATPGFQLLSEGPRTVRLESRFRYRAGEVYKRRSFWQRVRDSIDALWRRV